MNDLEGTVVREKIYHEAGAHTAQAMTPRRDRSQLIRGAGKIPAERDSFYNVLRTFDDDPHASRGVTMRVGRIPYINCYPVYGAIDRGIVALDAELVDGVPDGAQSRAWPQGTLDVSVVSAVEYARDARALSAAARSRDLLRRPGAQRDAVLASARPTRARRRGACSSAAAR